MALNSRSTTFIGIDLAWKPSRNTTGIAVAMGDREGIELLGYQADIFTIDEIFDFVIKHSTPNTVIASDAPMIIRNEAGRRPCETQISKKYAKRHASTHSSNLTLYPDPESAKLASMLEAQGFSQDINLNNHGLENGQWLFEVYTHSAYVELFDLPKIIKYKKGPIANRKQGLTKLRRLMWEEFTQSEPPLHPTDIFRKLTHKDLSNIRGKALKGYEDTIDAVLCAYIGYFVWYWGREKNELFGELESGIIINPRKPLNTFVKRID